MKKIMLSCLFTAIVMCAQAQWKFEFVAGPTLATFIGKEKKIWGTTDTNPKFVFRGNLGFRAEKFLSEKFTGGGGISVAWKGAAYTGDVIYYEPSENFVTVKVKFNKTLTYIDVPVYVKYGASQKIKLLAGVQPSFMLSAKIKNDANARQAFPELPKKEDAKDYYTSFDLAFLFGPHYQITDKFALQLLVAPGLLKMAKGEEYNGQGGFDEKKFNVKNTTLSLTFVYLIRE